MKKLCSNNGLTLIALVITILILAIISMLIFGTMGELQSNLDNANKNKLLSEIQMVQNIALQQYNTFLTTKDTSLLVGDSATGLESSTSLFFDLCTQLDITLDSDYYLLEKNDLAGLGISNAEDQYIVNYVTGEVMNYTTPFTYDSEPVYLEGRIIERRRNNK